ncbi:unnamed protein product [Bursaphelenchus xylophilus]|uniref:(pine wood nematode) hypothetical protein n=1 Tax=Bursaphelenchus xylophilus TaxID=6326 RepID=A0A1I7SSV2_BURXY|nr:unnamed protein product [Bursaphelenchus xylophilus]CAG9108870.1 unnamed protein product [Bursaphelenchus xylophilus]
MSNKKKAGTEVQSTQTRIAIVNTDRCKPKNCGQVCKRSCPVVKLGKQCIVVDASSKVAEISEHLCIGCGICIKKCPYNAISIINLPSNLERDTTHRYGPNSFKLHRLPTPRQGSILGLVGTNGIGKSTALKILSSKMKPNLGRFSEVVPWTEVLNYFRGSELQNYFTKLLEDKFKSLIKPQYVDQLPKVFAKNGFTNVEEALKAKKEVDNFDEIIDRLELRHLFDRDIKNLSGGEMQRFAIALCLIQKAQIYIFDEPSSFLDVKQRLEAAKMIRECSKDDNYVMVVEHDLAVLDYMSDYVCILYGVPSAYGVVTLPSGVREGINMFLEGFIHSENMRFRDTSLSFKVTDQLEQQVIERTTSYEYPSMTKTMGTFQLNIEGGTFSDSEIIVLLGENGTGKSTLIQMLAGKMDPDDTSTEVPELHISYKPQKLSPKFEGSVRSLMLKRIPDMLNHPTFKTDVLNPMKINEILDLDVQNLSGGELQRVALTICLGTPANVYLIDEPSAYLDSEQRLAAAKVIKRHILHAKKTAFIVEHDFMMSTYLADRVIVFDGQPGKQTKANSPQSLLNGMNKFLEILDVTFRRDDESHRPRINKKDSVKDSEQKKSGNYFFLDSA